MAGLRPGLGLGGTTQFLLVMLNGWVADMGDGVEAEAMAAEFAMPAVLIAVGRAAVFGRMAILGTDDDVVDDGVETSDAGEGAEGVKLAAPGEPAAATLAVLSTAFEPWK